MKIIFIANAMTPHQQPLADAFSAIEGVDYKFIEMKNIDRSSLPIGWRSDSINENVTTYSEYLRNKDSIDEEIFNADAVVVGGIYYIDLIKDRLDNGKLSFIYSERIYKQISDYLKYFYHYFKFRRKLKIANLHLLCASAFTYRDYKVLGCFSNRAYKWGYFINSSNEDVQEIVERKRNNSHIKIIWISRLIDWKHPELPIELGKRLKSTGESFDINMYGIGPKYEQLKDLIGRYNLDDCVFLKGELPNDELMRVIRQHDILLFTSDRNEGWGVVANEAMSNACALVASSAIGSVPYLVDDGIDGVIFKDQDIESLEQCVRMLIDNPQKRKMISINAFNKLKNVWSPNAAAANFIQLVEGLKAENREDISEGPCSRAEVFSDNWFAK